MVEVLAQRQWRVLSDEATRSIFRCPECGSFFDAARENPETGSLARKCASCDAWYPIVGAPRREAP